MSDSVRFHRRFRPTWQLVLVAALMCLMYLCIRTLRFTQEGFNLAFGGLFLLLPVLAIKPALRLPRRAKIVTLILLIPLLALSVLGLSAMVACDIPDAIHHRQLSRELCTIRQEYYSVHLVWEETSGGAVGPHGVGLEQRRSILPGLYAVRFLDYFEGAVEGKISITGPDRVSLYIPVAGYDKEQRDIHREYALKPWLYF